ncbi:MAG: transcription-repair coupling factor, partial [Thermoguttaceae bacterium]
MANAGTATSASDQLLDLVGRLKRQQGFAEVVASLLAGHAATLDGVWESACALAAAALAQSAPASLVAVCPHVDDVDDLADDLALFSQIAPDRFPAWERLPDEQAIADEIFGDRVRLLKKFQSVQAPKLVLCSIQSLLQPVPDRDALGRQTRLISLGRQLRVEDLSRWLAENGFHNTPAVELPGEFSIRGGILDVFAPDWFDPVRIEFFGDEIESIRRFEVSSQRSLEKLESVEVTIFPPGMHDRAHLADYLPGQSWF